MIGITCEGGLPGLPCRVTHLAGVTFCHPGSTCVTRKRAAIANLNNMAARRFFRRIHLPSLERRNDA